MSNFCLSKKVPLLLAQIALIVGCSSTGSITRNEWQSYYEVMADSALKSWIGVKESVFIANFGNPTTSVGISQDTSKEIVYIDKTWGFPGFAYKSCPTGDCKVEVKPWLNLNITYRIRVKDGVITGFEKYTQ